MINANYRQYHYFTSGKNAAGQDVPPADNAEPVGTITMAINLTSQSVRDNIKYADANYMGLTHAKVDETYFIQFGEERLKVLYVNPFGRLNQVFMKKI